ncbi:hypothetical protein Lal_00027127 [Lupinus albus]|nr:hypothetical protein Lal_00027127 [Lupinus albus]
MAGLPLQVDMTIITLNPKYFNFLKIVLSIITKGVKKELTSLKSLIRDYGQSSGQTTNPDKCRFYTGHASARKINYLASLLGFSVGQSPFTYLGVPLFVGKPTNIHLQPIVDKILNKMATWKGSTLSIMGRVELVKSIIHKMLVYSFHIYHWHVSLLNQIVKGIRNFLWYGDIGKKKLVTVSWGKVCPSMQSGGLGLKSMKMLNKPALLKLDWDMRSSNQDWVKIYRTRFTASSCYPTRYFKSLIWSGIRYNRSIGNMNSIWLVGNGLQINFWKDNLLGDSLIDIIGILLETINSLIAKVVEFSKTLESSSP